jgi:hypothetical protein
MSDAAASAPVCPGCGHAGVEIPWRTVAAVTRGALPPRQVFRLCRERECGLLYFGDAGASVPVSAVAEAPWFKGGAGVCYCFDYDAAHLGKGAEAAITARVRAGDCACDLRNPSGRCCLPEVKRLAPGDPAEFGAPHQRDEVAERLNAIYGEVEAAVDPELAELQHRTATTEER